MQWSGYVWKHVTQFVLVSSPIYYRYGLTCDGWYYWYLLSLMLPEAATPHPFQLI